MYWYEKAINTTQEDEGGEYDATMDNPTYALKAKVAELYLADEYDLEKDASYSGKDTFLSVQVRNRKRKKGKKNP